VEEVGKSYEIDASKYARNFVGRKTFESIKKDIKKLHSEGIKDICVNLEGKSISQEYTKFVAEMIYEYECTFKGLGNKEPIVEAYLYTGYFIKEYLGPGEYVKWFRKQVEGSDFPMMILDNRLGNKRLVTMNIIQPVRFDERYFYYNIIKPVYLEPGTLEQAIIDQEDIYTRESINIVDIATEAIGFRFASTKKERTMLDIFEGILSGKLKGFVSERNK